MTATRRIDPHVKVLDEAVVERARRRGLDALVYAPHFTRLPEIRRKAAALSTHEVRVVPGREVFTGTYRNRKHVLALGLEEPVPDFITLEAAMTAFERQDATVLAPHPEYLTIGLAEADIRQYRGVVDAVEVYNPKYLPGHAGRSRTIAADLDLPTFASSYAHLGRTVGDVWTETDHALGDDRAVASALTAGDARVGRRTGVGPRLRSAAEIGHIVWENTWKKADRIALPGIEPTHPRNDAYRGRFDDAYVY